jgi:DNA replication licensing factor MCM4
MNEMQRCNRSQVENINLPPTLLSRFDLIYLVLDKPDENSDGRLAAHLVQLYFKDAETSHKAKGVYDVSTLTRYISYARKNCHPRLTAEASTVLVKQYVDMRQQGVRNKTVTSTPRQLESLIRLSEAHARMRLSQTVELGDVNEAVRLMMAATMTAATNPETGEIDMDLITTGRSANDRQRLDALASELRGLIDDRRGDSFAVYEVAAELRERSQIDVSNDDVRAALDILVHENHLNAGSAGGYRRKRGIR